VPHTAALPIELYPPFFVSIYFFSSSIFKKITLEEKKRSARNENNNRIKKAIFIKSFKKWLLITRF